MEKPLVSPEYLGDGVYVSYDGWQMWLHVGAHTKQPVVALDDLTFSALQKYHEKIERVKKSKKEQ